MPTAELATDRFSIWGTSAVVCVTEPSSIAAARALVDETTAAIDLACSRFRPDSELLALNAAAGKGPFLASDLLCDLVETALRASEFTMGACDPTVLPALEALGYDTDIEEIRGRDLASSGAAVRPLGARSVSVDHASRTIELADGCRLDLGATAKARCADLAAERVASALATGCLVSLGGDLRVAGAPPAGGWTVAVTADSRTDPAAAADTTVCVTTGAVASSSTTLRSWTRGGRPVHHIIDPGTGEPASTTWSLVTVAAATCVAANALSTAAIVWGEDALFELPQLGAAGRLVRPDGSVELVGGWPEDESRNP
jgi:thiamine biosynthesis lipoprotein